MPNFGPAATVLLLIGVLVVICVPLILLHVMRISARLRREPMGGQMRRPRVERPPAVSEPPPPPRPPKLK